MDGQWQKFEKVEEVCDGDPWYVEDKCKFHCYQIVLIGNLDLEKVWYLIDERHQIIYLSHCERMVKIFIRTLRGRTPGASWWFCADLTMFLWSWMMNWDFFLIVSVILEENQMFDFMTSPSSLLGVSVLSSRRWRWVSCKCETSGGLY